jgi:hypothetical protein
MERPQTSLMRQEDAVTDTKPRLTRVDGEHVAPRPAAVVADTAAGFFGIGVLAASVVAGTDVARRACPSGFPFTYKRLVPRSTVTAT